MNDRTVTINLYNHKKARQHVTIVVIVYNTRDKRLPLLDFYDARILNEIIKRPFHRDDSCRCFLDVTIFVYGEGYVRVFRLYKL